MTDTKDYTVEITAPWDPLKCFKAMEEQSHKGMTAAFGEEMLTHTNNPKIMSMLAEHAATAVAHGADFADYEKLVFGMAAGRDMRDDTADFLRQAAERGGRAAEFDYVAALPKFIDRDSKRTNMYDAWHLKEKANLTGVDFTGYTAVGFAPEAKEIDLTRAQRIPTQAFDFSQLKELRSLSLAMADTSRAAVLRLPEGLEELDIRKNHRLAKDLRGQKNLKSLCLGEEKLGAEAVRLPAGIEELICVDAAGLAPVAAQLGDCPKLKKVSFIQCDMRAAGLTSLPKGIEELEISFPQNLGKEVADLSKYKSLKSVKFNGVDFSAAEVKLPAGCRAEINGEVVERPKEEARKFSEIKMDKVVARKQGRQRA